MTTPRLLAASGDMLDALNDLDEGAARCLDQSVVAALAAAVDLARMEPQPRPEVLVEVKGGVVQDVTATHPMRVRIVDYDNGESGDPDGFDCPDDIEGTWDGQHPQQTERLDAASYSLFAVAKNTVKDWNLGLDADAVNEMAAEVLRNAAAMERAGK